MKKHIKRKRSAQQDRRSKKGRAEGIGHFKKLSKQLRRLSGQLFAALPVRPSRKLVQMQLLCLVVSAILAVLVWMTGQQSSPLKQGNLLARESEGGSSVSYQLVVDGLIAGETLPVSVDVSPKRYTMQEADQLFREIVRSIEDRILGDNPNLSAVSENLILPASIPEYGIKLLWDYTPYLDDADAAEQKAYFKRYSRVIEEDGTVNNGGFQADEAVSGYLSLVLSAYIEPDGNPEYEKNRYQSQPFQIHVYVTAKQYSDAERLKLLLANAISDADRQNYSSDALRLPDEVAGKRLRYSGKTDNSWMFLPLLGLIAAAGLYLKEAAAKKDRKKQRKAQLLLDYPELVSKLMVYVGAGLTVRNAFERISRQYDKMVERKSRSERFLYEEMRISRIQMERGVPEGQVYLEFGKRINLRPYTKLCSLIEQNRKNGTKNMRMLLNLEMADAFEQRKNTARRLGEEAGTKLLLPLFLLLGVVMAIVIFPAMMTLG